MEHSYIYGPEQAGYFLNDMAAPYRVLFGAAFAMDMARRNKKSKPAGNSCRPAGKEGRLFYCGTHQAQTAPGTDTVKT